jgi:hypothetical protein
MGLNLVIVFFKSHTMKNYLFYLIAALLIMGTVRANAQFKIAVENGLIYINDGTFGHPDIKKYSTLTDSLDKNLKLHPNDTTSLFYRAMLYLRYNSIAANPDLSTDQATNKLLLARKIVDRADSLKMQNFNLKVLRAQLCKELTSRYAPMDAWRYNDKQIADRKKKYDYFKGLANKYYDQLVSLDSGNAYDYQKLKVH